MPPRLDHQPGSLEAAATSTSNQAGTARARTHLDSHTAGRSTGGWTSNWSLQQANQPSASNMAQVSASSSFPLTNMAGSSYATHHYLSSATGAPTSISNDSRSLHLQAQQGLPGVNVVPFSNPSLSSYPTPARDDQDASNKRLIRDAPVPMAFAQSNLSLAGPSRNQGPTAASAKGQRVPNPFVMPTDQVQQVRRRRRPPISYAGLIAQAINSSPEGRLTLREIYQWIAQQYPQLYPMAGPESHGWQNTVRHNLSLNKAFKKQPRTSRDVPDSPSASAGTKKKGSGTASNRKGKGGFWVLDPVRGAALLNAASKSEHLHEEGIDRERNGNGLASSSRLHCTDSGTSTETSANLLSSQTSLPSTNSFPSVLLPRPRTGSPSESNSTLPRSISATGSSLGQPTAPMSSSFYSLSIPPSPHTAPLQHSMYSSIPVDATGRPRGYTIGTTDQGRDPSWFAGSMAAQHAGATSFSPSPYNMPQYAAEMPAGSNGFGTALMDQRGSERYGTRARNQTTTGIPTASQAPWYPQRLGQPQWSLSTSSASKLSGGPVMGMGNGMGGGSAHGVGDASAAAVPRATGDGLLGRGGPFRGYDTANAVTSGSGTRTTLSTHLITSSGDTPAIQFPPAGTTSSAYGMSSLDHEGGAAGGGNGGRMASHHAPPNQSSWQTHNHPMGMFTAKDDEGLGSTGHGHGHQHAHGHSVGAASQPRSQDGRPAAGYDWPSSARPQFSRG